MWYNYIAIFLTLIAIHELGHIIAYLIFNYNPDIKLKWWGVLIGEKIVLDVKAWQMGIIYISGILTGLLFLMIYNKYDWYLVYLLMSMIDIYGIIQINGLKKNDLNLTIRELRIKEAKEILNKGSI